MKKRITLLMFLLFTVISSGCSMTDSLDELTIPPEQDEYKEEIKVAIKDYLPQNTRPIIPPTEDDVSYIKLVDLDGDGIDEALVFYTLDLKENPLRILVLKKEKNKWNNMPEIKIVGQELDKVLFKDLNGDGGKDIIIGSKIKYSLDKSINIHSIKESKIESIFRGTYDEVIIDDLNDDNLTEMLILKLDRESQESFGELYKNVEGKIERIDKTSFNENAEINYAVYDYIYEKNKGIIVSTTVNLDIVNTYIMTVRDDKLVNLIKDGLIQKEKQASTKILLPRDINKDGIIDIAIPNKAQRSNSDLINWVTEWYSFDGNNGIELKMMNYYDERLNFTFDLPLKWNNKLTITNLTKNENTIKQEEYVKVEYRDDEDYTKLHLFTVYIYDKDKLKIAQNSQISKDYVKAIEDPNRIFYIYKNKDIDEYNYNRINNEIKKIQETFKLL